MKDVSKGTILRTIMLVLVLFNMVLKGLGKDIINVQENEVASLIEAVIEIGVIVSGFWKNNSFSKQAIMSDTVMRKLKAGEHIE